MSESGKILGDLLDLLSDKAKPGVSTLELDKFAEKFIRSKSSIPSFLGYEGFPNSLCASVNNVVVHGIPKKESILKDGDIITIDGGVIYDGWHSDAAVSLEIGEVAKEVKILNEATFNALKAGINAMNVGAHLNDISTAIEDSVIKSERDNNITLEIITNFGGHGIGKKMHQEPWLANYRTAHKGPKIVEGSTLCIEPILTLGTDKTKTLEDGWTVVTSDDKIAAHWEHTLVATSSGAKILTPNKFSK